MENKCSFVTCEELDTLNSIINNIDTRKLMDDKNDNPLLHLLFYKLTFISSKISIKETNDYLRRHPENTNVFIIKNSYDKIIFNMTMCFLNGIDSILLCVSTNKNITNIIRDGIFTELLINMPQFIKNFYENEKTFGIKNIADFFIVQLNSIKNNIDNKCNSEVDNIIKLCSSNITVSYNKVGIDEKDEHIPIVSVYNRVDNIKHTLVKTKNNKYGVLNKFVDITEKLPEYHDNIINNIKHTICNASYFIGSYVPEPVRLVMNGLYNIVKYAVQQIDAPITISMAARLVATYYNATPETLKMIDGTVVSMKILHSISKQTKLTYEMGSILSIDSSAMTQEELNNLKQEQDKVFNTIYNIGSSSIKQKYKLQLKKEKTKIKHSLTEQKIIQEQKLKEEMENNQLENIRQIIQYENQEKDKEFNKYIYNLMNQIESKVELLIELKIQYKDINKPIFFFTRLNEEQKLNLKKQRILSSEIKNACKEFFNKIQSITDTQLTFKCLEFLKLIKDMSKENFLGLEEIYEYLGEEMDETKKGWSYNMLNTISSRFPNFMSEQRKKAITELIEPVETVSDININTILLTSIPFALLFKFKGLRENINLIGKYIKYKSQQKGIIPTKGRPLVKPEFYPIKLERRKFLGSTSAIVGGLAFNCYLYGNLAQKTYEELNKFA